MNPMSLISGILGGGSALYGLLTGNAQANAARQQAQQALTQMSAANDAQYQGMLANNNRTLQSMAGQGADALLSYGKGLGNDMAQAGVYNSSATAGALANAARSEDTALANTAAQNYYSANQLFNNQQAQLAQMRLGQANTSYNQANAALGQSAAGLGSYLGNLAQTQLQQQPQQSPISNAQYGQGIGGLLQQNGITDADMYSQQAMAPPAMGTYGDPTGAYGQTRAAGVVPIPSYGQGVNLGTSTQNTLGSSGANAYRPSLPAINGTINQGSNLYGNAGGIGNGGQGNPYTGNFKPLGYGFIPGR